MAKDNKSTTDVSKKTNKKTNKHPVLFGIMGVGVAIVIASMAFSCYLVIIGTKTMTPKYFLLPQLAAAIGVVGTVFYKAFSNIK